MENTNNRTSNREAVVWVAGGCLLVLVLIVGVFIAGFAGLYWLGSQNAEEVTVQVNIPTDTRIGDPFEFSIAVTNNSREAVQLNSIDFSMGLMRGVIVDRTIPDHTESSQYKSLDGREYLTYYFDQQISPGGTLVILFSGTAVATGAFGGDVDVCINSEFNCATHVARTLIK